MDTNKIVNVSFAYEFVSEVKAILHDARCMFPHVAIEPSSTYSMLCVVGNPANVTKVVDWLEAQKTR